MGTVQLTCKLVMNTYQGDVAVHRRRKQAASTDLLETVISLEAENARLLAMLASKDCCLASIKDHMAHAQMPAVSAAACMLQPQDVPTLAEHHC